MVLCTDLLLITKSGCDSRWCATCITNAYKDLVVSMILIMTFQVEFDFMARQP